MFRFLPLIWKNSLRNRRRSLLTIASIAMSLCLLGILFAVYRALFHGDTTPESALRLITRHRVSLTVPLPGSYEQRIRAIPGVRDVSVYNWFGGTYKDNRDPKNQFARFAVEPAPLLNIVSEIGLTPEEKQNFIQMRTATIASEIQAREQGWKVGDKITLKGDIYPYTLELTLVGIYKDPNKIQSMFFNDEYLQQLIGPASRRYHLVGTFYIRAENADAVSRIAKAIDQSFDNSPEPTKTETEQAFTLAFVSFLGNVKLFLGAICAAVTFTILLVSGNTMAMSVRERIREVGIFKTLGFTNGEVLSVILGEAMVISLLGGCIGVGLAWMLCTVLANAPGMFFFSTVKLTPDVAGICVGVALLIGFISAFIPASNASRTPILQSLRYSG